MNTSNVTVGKPKTSGALFHAPVGTTLPVNATADLASEYKELGYASSDGITEAQEITVNDIVAWGGDVVDSSEASKKKTFKIKLIEAVNKEVLSVVYNADNVTGTLETGIEIHENGDPHEREIFVFDEILKGGVLQRTVIPDGQVTAIGEIKHVDSDVLGYELTIAAYPSTEIDNDYLRRYIIKPSRSSELSEPGK